MRRIVLLDAGVIGLLVSSPDRVRVEECVVWVTSLRARADVFLPDVTAFEVRRELLRLGAFVKLARLAQLRTRLPRAEVNEDAWLKAAEFWAIVRRAGRPTASPDALDADAILAGVAATVGDPGDQVVIATTNVRHLGWFPGVEARAWNEVR